jgi:hypothetical protein
MRGLLNFTKAFEVNQDFIGDDGYYSGLAAVKNNVDLGGDVFLDGAFDFSKIPSSKLRVLWNHNDDVVVGKHELAVENETGLNVTGNLILEIEKARDTRILVQRQAIDGLSLGYFINQKDLYYKEGIRYIKKVYPYEYSFVPMAMNKDALVNEMKSCKLESVRDCEHYLRDVCMLSRSEAKTLISKIKASRDDEPNFDNLAASLLKLNQTLRGQK